MNCISETENAKDNITEEQQSTNSSIDNQPSSNKDKDSRTTNIIKSDSEICLHTQNNDEMNFKENPINDNSFDKVELSNDLTDGRSDSQFMYKKSKSVPGLKKACKTIHQTALKKNIKRKGSLKIAASAKKSKISGSGKISLNKGGKKHLVGKGGKKLITYAPTYSLKKSHTTVLSKHFKTFDKAIESDGPSMNKKSNKGKISMQRKKKKKIPDVKERSMQKQKIKRLDSDSNSLSSEDDLPLSVLRREHPVTAQHEDSDGSYKPNETDINSTDSDCSTHLPIHGQSKFTRGTETKRRRDNTYKRVSERKAGKKPRGKTGKKKTVSGTKSCSKKHKFRKGQSDPAVKEKGMKGSLEMAGESNNGLQVIASSGFSHEQNYTGINERDTIISYSELI